MTRALHTPARPLYSPETEWLRALLWQAVKEHCRCVVGGLGRQSAWGHDWEPVSMAGILPGKDEMPGALMAATKLIATVVQSLDVERPGGVLVVRGDPESIHAPSGVTVTLTKVGDHAYRASLGLIAHSATMEEARAYQRTLERVTL